jgi:polysaccharide export outer membrane protein
MNARSLLRICGAALLLAAAMGSAAAQEKPAFAVAQTTASDTPDVAADSRSSAQPVLAQRYPRYLLRPSDVLQLTFPITPEFDQTISIQPDGFVSLRGVGDLHIAGKTLPELAEALHKVYGGFLNDPIINIEMKDFEKPYFTAGGELGKPGKYELRGDTTVAEAVAMAGGFTEKSKHSEVVVFRRVPGGWELGKRLNVKLMMANKDLGEDIYLRPGDMIFVPKNNISKIKDLKDMLPTPGLGIPIP